MCLWWIRQWWRTEWNTNASAKCAETPELLKSSVPGRRHCRSKCDYDENRTWLIRFGWSGWWRTPTKEIKTYFLPLRLLFFSVVNNLPTAVLRKETYTQRDYWCNGQNSISVWLWLNKNEVLWVMNRLFSMMTPPSPGGGRVYAYTTIDMEIVRTTTIGGSAAMNDDVRR